MALAALILLGGGWLWLRNSPLVSVEHVQITGVQGVRGRSRSTPRCGAPRGR